MANGFRFPEHPDVDPRTRRQEGGSIFREAFRPEILRRLQTQEFAPSHLAASLTRTQQDRFQMRGLRQKLAASIGNQEARQRRRLGAAASSAVAQAGVRRPTSFASAVEDVSRIARARQGIVDRGEPAIQQQALRDRVAFVQRGARRRGRLQQALSKAMQIREGVNVGVADADQLIAQSRADLFGGIAGAAVGAVSTEEGRSNVKDFFGFG